MLILVRRLTAALAALLLLGNVAFIAGVWLTREPAPRPLTAERVYAIARPAMVLVQSEFDVKVSIPDPVVPDAQAQRIHDQLQQMIDRGELAYDQTAIDNAAIRIILDDPATYFAAGSTRSSEDDQLFASGTGFFVTESGYLVTAAHVVAPTKDDVRKEILDFAGHPTEQEALRKDLADSIRSDLGVTPTDAELDQLTRWYQDYVAQNLTVDGIESKFFLGTGTVHAGSALESTAIRASIDSADAPFPNRDLAVLKADVTRVPALELAPGEPAIGGTAIIAGYPRKGYLQEEAQFDATVPAVYTSGRVTGREARGTFTAYGTDAAASPGNSGGPVLDGQGRVLGVLSYAQGDASGGNGFFIPSSLVRDDLSNDAIHAGSGSLTPSYRQALAEGDALHYRHELPILERIHRDAPADAYVSDDISRAQSGVLAGQDRTPIAILDYAPVIVAASLVGVVFGTLVLISAWALSIAGRRPRGAAEVTPAEADVP